MQVNIALSRIFKQLNYSTMSASKEIDEALEKKSVKND